MKKLALVLCMVPGVVSADNFTTSFYAADSATGLSTFCISDMSNLQGSLTEILIWIMGLSNGGHKEAFFRGCSVPITNTQEFRDIRDDLLGGGYTVQLNNSTNIITVTWP